MVGNGGFRDDGSRCRLLSSWEKPIRGAAPSATVDRHHSADTPGSIVRNQTVFGSMIAPGGEAELRLENVRIPKSNIIMGEGRASRLPRAALGRARIHHCMRSIGRRSGPLRLWRGRVENRVAFGRKLSEQGSIRQDVARRYCENRNGASFTLKAADQMDRYGKRVPWTLLRRSRLSRRRWPTSLTAPFRRMGHGCQRRYAHRCILHSQHGTPHR